MSVVLCIGGLDPAGRAGILADAKAVEALGARAVCVAAALTFQSSKGARGYVSVDAEVLRRQISLLVDDEPIEAVKLGQLGSLENARLLATVLPRVPIIVDTPLVTSSGADLFPPDAVRAGYVPLLARATLVTPNALEVFALTDGKDDAQTAAATLSTNAVLLKGGHLEEDAVVDRLYRGGTLVASWQSQRVPGRFRGTGCRLASAIAAGLALGEALEPAIGNARDWLVNRLLEESRS